MYGLISVTDSGQRYRANADTIDSNFIISSNTQGSALTPSVCTLEDRRILVVWAQETAGRYDIYSRWYQENGAPVNSDFRVNEDTTGQQIMPRLAVNQEGQFVITWVGIVNNYAHVFARLYNSSGQALGPEFQVSQSPLDQSRLSIPNVAMSSGGSFMIVWTAPDGNGYLNVYARGFDSAGASQGSVFMVNQRYGTESHKNPDIETLVNSTFLISWQSDRLGSDDIYYKTVTLDGTTAIPVTTVTNSSGSQISVAVTSDEYLNNIFVWTDTRNGNADIYSNWLGTYWPNHAFCGSGFNGMIPMAWDPPYGYTNIVNYTISKREGTGGSFTEVFHLEPSTRALPNQMLDWIDTDVENGKTYSYKISMDVAEAGAASWFVSGTPGSQGYSIISKWSDEMPIIDGRINENEWADAFKQDISGANTDKPVTMYIMNNESMLYIAIDDSNDANIEDANTVELFFSTNENGDWHTYDGYTGIFYLMDQGILNYRLTGTYPDNLEFQNQGRPTGVFWDFNNESGHVQAEIAINLTLSPLSVSPGGGFGAAVSVSDPGNFYTNPYGKTGCWPQGSLWEAVETLGDIYLATSEDTITITGWPMAGRTPRGMSWAEGEDILYPPFDSTKTFVFADTNWAFATLSCRDGILFGDVTQYYRENSPLANVAFSMNAETGSTLWHANIINTLGIVMNYPAVGDSLVYYGGQAGDGIYAYRKSTGMLEWIANSGSVIGSSPILDGM